MPDSAFNATSEDEVDLLKLLIRIFGFLGRYRIWLVALSLTGMVAGGVFYLIVPPVYESRLIVRSRVMTPAEQFQILDNWQKILEGGGHGLSAQQFCLPENTVRQLLRIEGETLSKTTASRQCRCLHCHGESERGKHTE
jgi:hypothetical protein